MAILLIENIQLNQQEIGQSIIDHDNKKLWNNLAQLYKSIGENEIYRNIEESKIKTNQSLKGKYIKILYIIFIIFYNYNIFDNII